MGKGNRAGVRLAAILVALSLVFAACGDDDDAESGRQPEGSVTTEAAATSAAGDTEPDETTAPSTPAEDTTTADAEEPATGGTLTLNSAAPSNMIPYAVFGPIATTGSRERFAIYDALAVLETNGDVQYRIAESMESDDGIVWTIALRDDVTFSDGTPLDAEAVRYNWARMADPTSASSQAAIAAQIASAETVDDFTLQVTLTEANGQFPRLVATSAFAFIGSPTALEASGEQFNTSPVGAGAFTLDEWVDGSFMRLVRNPDYFGEGPYLDELVFQYIEDPTGAAQYNTLQAGDLDLLTGATPELLSQAVDAGYEVIETPTNGGATFQMNVTVPPFDDPRARQALALAFDFDEMNASAFGGLGEPAATLFIDSSPFYADIPLLPEPDSQRAQELFDELAAEGKPVDFTILMFADLDQFDDWLIARLSSFANVSVRGEVVGRPAAVEAYRAGNFQATLRPVQFIEPEPLVSDNFASDGAQNYGKYSNPEVDAALATARTSQDEAERKQAYETVQQAIAADVPTIFYRRLGATTVVQDTDSFGALPMLSDGLLDVTLVWHQ